ETCRTVTLKASLARCIAFILITILAHPSQIQKTRSRRRGITMTTRSPGRARRRRSLARGDIPPAPRPAITPQEWADDAQAIDLPRAWAEPRATDTISWYLRDKQPKRWASRLLRAAAVLFAVTGGVLPLISGSTHHVNPDLGYVSLALAAGCVAF